MERMIENQDLSRNGPAESPGNRIILCTESIQQDESESGKAPGDYLAEWQVLKRDLDCTSSSGSELDRKVSKCLLSKPQTYLPDVMQFNSRGAA
jgi:hypothetical protein